jgi:hypothetical protein
MRIEKMRARAQEKMANRVALVRKKANGMRGEAHTRRIGLAAKAVQRVEQIRSVALGSNSPFKCCFKS